MNNVENNKKNIEQVNNIPQTDNMREEKQIVKKEPNKGTKKIFSTSETMLLVIASLLVGLSIGFLLNKNRIVLKNTEIEDKYLKEFAKNYKFVIDNYYEDVDKEALINSAIAGMMESLDDPYSVYIDDDQSDTFSITLNGSYKGIGVQIAKEEKSGYMLITGVFKDSPAAESGLIPGDLVTQIDNKSTVDMSASDFSNIVKTGENDTYSLKVLRGKENLDVSITRKIVTLSSVTSEMFEESGKKIGYIYIGIFANNTYTQFKEELTKLEEEKIDYLIIDVRGNTGGHLTAVDSILDIFLNRNQIMYQFEHSDKKTPVYGTGTDSKSYEIILLGDEVSASASEVLIAGLKENLNAKFIGKKTYGKGTVQELVTLSDGTQYKITVNKWLTPKGNWINETKGITPDIDVSLDSKYYETYKTEDDTQIEAAFQYIKETAN